MSGLTVTEAGRILSSIFDGTKYVAFHSASPNRTGANELSGNGYARQASSFALVSDTATSEAAISLTAVGGDLVMTHFSICSTVSGDSYQLEGELAESVTIADGETRAIVIGNISAQLRGATVGAQEVNQNPDPGPAFTPIDPADKFALLEAGDESTLAAAMGLGAQEPDHYVLLTASNGGADIVGTGDLTTAIGTPLFEVANTTLGIDTVHLNSNGDGVGCSNSTDWNVSTESMTVLYVGTSDLLNGSNSNLLSKGTTAAGWSIRTLSSGRIEGVFWNTLGHSTASSDHCHYLAQERADLVAVLFTNDTLADYRQLITNLGRSAVGLAHAHDSSNGDTFRVGTGIASAGQFKPALVAQWLDTNAEGIREEHLRNLLDYLGVGVFHDIGVAA